MLFVEIKRYQLSFEQVPYQEMVPMGSNVKETTGIDIAEDRTIEIAATHSPDDVRSRSSPSSC